MSRGWQRGTWGCPPPRRDLGEQNQQAEGTPRPADQGTWGKTINQTLFHRQRQGPPQISLPGDTSLPETLPTHCHHRRVLPRCPRSRPSAGGSCLARGCWGAGGPPLCRLAHPRGRCPSVLSQREAGSLLSSVEDRGLQGWGWRVPASQGSWGRDGRCRQPPWLMPQPWATLHISSPPQQPLPAPCVLAASSPIPAPLQCPKSPQTEPTARVPESPHWGEGRDPEPYPVPGGWCSGVCTGGDTLLASEPTKPLSVSGDTMRCSCRCIEEGRIGAKRPQQVVGVLADGACSPRGLTLRGWCWVTALPALLLRRDRSIRGGSGSPRGGLAVAGGSSAVAGDRWPRVLPGHGGSLAGSGAALLSAGCLQGEDGA